MRILVLSLNYAPEPTGFAPHTTALCEYLASRRWHVTAITGFPFAPSWRRWDGYRGRFMSRTERADGTVLIRVTHFIPRRPGSMLQRLAMEGTFVLSAAAALIAELIRRRTRPDIVLYVGAQPALAMLARVIAAGVGSPYFVNINDLATQAATDVGIVRDGWLQRALSRFEFSAYSGAAGASVLCPRFAEWLAEHGYATSQVRTIRSPIDTAMIRPAARTQEFRRQHGIPEDAFVILFSGSMGLKQGLANVVAAAELVKRDERPSDRTLHWVLVGDGETRDAIVELVAARKLESTVSVVPFQPEREMSAMFAAADALLLNQVSAVKDSVIPSKLLTYMAAGRPVLAAVNRSSQGAEILRDADGGVVVAADDPRALAQAARALSVAASDELATMGARNRAYAEAHFDQNKVLAAHEAFMLERLTAPTGSRWQREAS